MPKDVLITPASANVQFKQTSGNTEGLIELTNDGYLKITSSNSGILLGDTATNVFIGDGVTSVDLVFEQSGAVRALAGRTLTIGQADSTVRVNAPLQITNTTLVANLNADLLDGLTSTSFANAAFGSASFNQANAAFITANAAFIAANSAGVYANGAFLRANNSLNANSGGTVTSNVTIQLSNRGVDGFLVQGPTGSIRTMPNSGSGNYNGIVQANDVSVIFSSGAQGLGSLAIASWNSITSGFRMGANGNVVITSANTSSIDSNTGGLVISNGVGITGNLFMSSANNFSGAGNGDSYRMGWIDNYFNRSTQFGGMEFKGTYLSLQATTYVESDQILYIRGLLGNEQGNNTVLFRAASPARIQNSATSTSTTTGALIVGGGVGVTGNVYADAVYDGGIEIITFANNAFNTANAAFIKANTSTGGNSFGVIYASNNSTFANSTTSNDRVTFSGENGVLVAANATSKVITFAGTPGLQGLTVDYGLVTESITYSLDYGTL